MILFTHNIGGRVTRQADSKTVHPESGFTFIELCIVLMVGGVILSAFLSAYMVYAQKQRYEITRDRSYTLQQALASYVTANKRLPCPADPTIPLMVAGSGKEVNCAAGASPSGGIMATGSGDAEIWTGAVPANALRVAVADTVDGWGNQFTYVVSRKLTAIGGQVENASGVTPFGTIELVDTSGTKILDTDKLARYLLLSAGPTGLGSWTQQGARRACPTGTMESENCDNNASFVTAALTRKHGSTFYDDILIHDTSIRADPNATDRTLLCNGKKMFFAPLDPAADRDGCVGISMPTPPECAEGQSLSFRNGAYQCVDAARGTVAGFCQYIFNGEPGSLYELGRIRQDQTGGTAGIQRQYGSPEGYISSANVRPPAVMTYSYYGRRNSNVQFNCGCQSGWTPIKASEELNATYSTGTDGGSDLRGVSAGRFVTCVKN